MAQSNNKDLDVQFQAGQLDRAGQWAAIERLMEAIRERGLDIRYASSLAAPGADRGGR